MRERRMREEEVKVRLEHDDEKIANLIDRLNKTRAVCRENTRELLRSKKVSHSHEKKLLEDKTKLLHDLEGVRKQLYDEQHRNEIVEKVVENRLSKSQEKVVSDLRHYCTKLEDDLKQARVLIIA